MLTGACQTVFILVGSPVRQDSKPAPSVSDRKPAPPVLVLPARGLPFPPPVAVADVIKGLGLDESEMVYIEEPPGKLRALHWSKVKLPGTDAEVNVRIDIAPALDVFSTKFRWNITAVRAAAVSKVTITPASRRID